MNGQISATAEDGGVPLLGGTPGSYLERQPAAPLQNHFEAIWLHSTPSDSSGSAAIVPDGSADIVWFNGALRLAGPDRHVKFERSQPGTTVIGFRFRPGAALAWLRTPVSSIVDGRFNLDAFWGSACAQANARIAEATNPRDIVQRMEDFLIGKCPQNSPSDQLHEAIFQIIRRRSEHATPVIAELQRELGMSERTIRRRCEEAFGYGPKTLDRIIRFQKFLQLARISGGGQNAELASSAGYADQPHASREARELAGMTMMQIRAQMAAKPSAT